MLNVKQGGGGDDTGTVCFTSPPASSFSIIQLPPRQFFLGNLCKQSLLRWLTIPHCQCTGRRVLRCSVSSYHNPMGVPALTTCSLAGNSAAAFTVCSLRAWLRFSSSAFLPPMRRLSFTSQSLIPSTVA